MVLIAAVLVALLLPTPWSLVVLIGGLFAEVGEIVWGRRLARRWRARTGAEAMIGMSAEVVSACRPRGQVRVHGELWEAIAEAGADPGGTVRIESLDGLTLIVVPLSRES